MSRCCTRLITACLCVVAAVGNAPSLEFRPVLPAAAADSAAVAAAASGLDVGSDTVVPSDPPYDIPYDPEKPDRRFMMCVFGGSLIDSSNAVQLQNHGAGLRAQWRNCTFADWVACGTREEAECNGPIVGSTKACMFVENPTKPVNYQDTFGKGSCVFDCYYEYEINSGIGFFYEGLVRYNGSYVDLEKFPDPVDSFACLSKSAEGAEVCAQTVDSTGHPCSSCYVPAAFYPFHRPELAEGETPEGLDHWCINTRGFPRYCDFLREPAQSCDADAHWMYAPDWEGPTYEPTSTTTTPTTATTPSEQPNVSPTLQEPTSRTVGAATNGQHEMLTLAAAALTGVASFFV